MPIVDPLFRLTLHCMRTGRHILLAEDDVTEIALYKRAFTKLSITSYSIVRDGVETIEYLQGVGIYADRDKYRFPQWLVLDLKMPRMTGLDVLEWLHDNPVCRIVPTIMLSNSDMEGDVNRAYELGVNAFFTKPTKAQEMVEVFTLIANFWAVAKCPTVSPTALCA